MSIHEKSPSHSFTNEKDFFTGDSILTKTMTTKKYLNISSFTKISYTKTQLRERSQPFVLEGFGDLIKLSLINGLWAAKGSL
jgi:hypothetical protein